MIKSILKTERSEFGKQVRKEYESGDREFGGRSAMQIFRERKDYKSNTLTTVFKDNLVLEYEA